MATREALTIRFPDELLDQARSVKEEGESVNELVIRSVEREVRRRRGLKAHEQVMRIREEIAHESGASSDSTELIRALREGRERRE